MHTYPTQMYIGITAYKYKEYVRTTHFLYLHQEKSGKNVISAPLFVHQQDKTETPFIYKY